MWEETHFGISVKPVQWIARMDFNSGWMLPNVPGIVDALKEISTWTLEMRKEKHGKISKYFSELYSNEAIINAWIHILKDVVIPEVESNFTAKKLKVSAKRKTMLRACQSLQFTFSEFNQVHSEYKESMASLTQKHAQTSILKYMKTLKL